MKKIKYILLFITGIMLTSNVYAFSLDKVTMDIHIDKEGNANVIETWDVTEYSNTEIYKRYDSLGEMAISNFSVTMNGESFTTLDDWNIDATFSEKEYKAGLNYIDNGVELCFGITKYGSNKYIMRYTISNFVVDLNDANMIYFGLLSSELQDKPEYVYVKIYSDFKYNYNWDVWGYGNYGGYTYIHEDGYIELIDEDGLNDDEYLVVLAKFPKNTFNPNYIIDDEFSTYLNMAEDGAINYEDKTSIIDIIIGAILFLINLLPFIIVFVAAANHIEYGTKKMTFNKGYKKITKDAPYFRDLPCQKNIFEAYWLACQYGLVKKKTDFLGALLLKWIKNKNVENIKIQNKNKEKRAIKLLNTNGLSQNEIELYNMMNTASIDGVLESKEFERWCKTNYKKILNWFNKIIDEQTMIYVGNGLITEENKSFGKKYLVSNNLFYKAQEMAGLKKFLNEFSNISKREAIEVTLWEEYLMYAQIFGIAKKVAKEFKELYPDVITEEMYEDVIFIHHISYSGVSAATTARDRAQGYSSGGGGFSSGGGGGGSFGGGSFGGGGGSR